MGDLLDNIPTTIPVPNDAPLEIPIVNLSSSDNKWNINIARNRLDLFYNFHRESTTFSLPTKYTYESDIYEEVLEKSHTLCINLMNRVDINRIGIVGNFFEEIARPAKNLQKKYLKIPSGDTNTTEVAIRYNARTSLGNLELNDHINIYNSILANRDKQLEGITIVRDINNVQTETPITLKQYDDILTRVTTLFSFKKMSEVW